MPCVILGTVYNSHIPCSPFSYPCDGGGKKVPSACQKPEARHGSDHGGAGRLPGADTQQQHPQLEAEAQQKEVTGERERNEPDVSLGKSRTLPESPAQEPNETI